MPDLPLPSDSHPTFGPENVLGRAFYERRAEDVARALLGRYLVRELGSELLVGRISETEAYGGETDSASHASRGRTTRNAPMFGAPGHAYVYLIYGLHEMFNIVTEREGEAGAVLIRALEPVAGIGKMRALRQGKPDFQLANGPGKLAQAMSINRKNLNTHDLCLGQKIWLTPGSAVPKESVIVGPRVGIDFAVPADRDAPLRFRVGQTISGAW